MTYTPEQIEKMIDSLDQEIHDIKDNILRICWFMRGGVTYDQGMMLSFNERKMIDVIVEENLETTKKTQLPFF